MNKRQLNSQPKSAGRGRAEGGSGKGHRTEEQRLIDQSEEFDDLIDDSAFPSDEFVGTRARMSSF